MNRNGGVSTVLSFSQKCNATDAKLPFCLVVQWDRQGDTVGKDANGSSQCLGK